MDDPNGWPDKPGVPLNPEQSRRHWLQPVKPGRAPYPVFWVAEKGWAWNGVPHWPTQDTASRYRYVGPCLTPAEVAARVAEARDEALEEAAAVASKGEADTKEVSENPAYDADTRHTFYTMGRSCKEIAAAIRALKDNQVKPWLSTDAQAEFKTLPEINGPKDYTQEIKD